MMTLLAGDRRQELGKEASTEVDNETGGSFFHGDLHCRNAYQTVRVRLQEVLH